VNAGGDSGAIAGNGYEKLLLKVLKLIVDMPLNDLALA
jgi:hypothetical protein